MIVQGTDNRLAYVRLIFFIRPKDILVNLAYLVCLFIVLKEAVNRRLDSCINNTETTSVYYRCNNHVLQRSNPHPSSNKTALSNNFIALSQALTASACAQVKLGFEAAALNSSCKTTRAPFDTLNYT